MTALLTLLALGRGEAIEPFLQPDFRDASFRAKIVDKDYDALEGISKDFAQGYRLGDLTVRLKEPFKVRADARSEDSQVSLIVNGLVRAYKLPHLKPIKMDLSKRPGNRQTALDFGLLTPSLFSDLFDSKFVRRDESGKAVFDLSYKPVFDDKTRYRIYLDPKTKTLSKREWFDRTGVLKATFTFDRPIQENGAAMPTEVTVTNSAGEVGGRTRYEDVKLNRGIPDSVFAI